MTGFRPKHLRWIAVDWGTTHLRVWAIGHDGQVIAGRNSDRGMAKLDRSEFEPAIRALIADWIPADRDIPIIACGMVGSRQGWAEAEYIATPCAPPGVTHLARPANTTLSVHILAGIKQVNPADVMRGEETQIAGYLRQQPDFDGVICLPGTHTKWVRVSAGKVVRFQTFMTGELFGLLSEKSVLHQSVATSGWDSSAFLQAVDDAVAQPASMAAELFRLRASSLIDAMPPQKARARLSGLLIGLELAAARPIWRDIKVTIVGRNDLAHLYQAGLEARGVSPEIAVCEDMALAGLIAAYETWTMSVP